MKSYPLNEARAELSKLIDRALDGEPQRVTRYGKDAVFIVSEADWQARSPMPSQGQASGFSETRTPPIESFGTLLGRLLELAQEGPITDRPWKERPLGRDIE